MKKWTGSNLKDTKVKITNLAKDDVSKEASALINNTLKPLYIKSEKENNFSNQLFDIDFKWRGNSLYFLAKYKGVGENALSPTFESKFARLVFVDHNKFNLSYMRHNDKWFELHTGLSSQECFKAIETQPYFVV